LNSDFLFRICASVGFCIDERTIGIASGGSVKGGEQ
jgi:hypothetical protein